VKKPPSTDDDTEANAASLSLDVIEPDKPTKGKFVVEMTDEDYQLLLEKMEELRLKSIAIAEAQSSDFKIDDITDLSE
jgi:hypothetical protein